MANVYKNIKELIKRKENFVVATIISKTGSGPREKGTKMIIRKDLSIIGTIGGGSLEAHTIVLAKGVFQKGENLIKEFSLKKEEASELGMACGGNEKVFIEYVDLEKEETYSVFNTISDCLRKSINFSVETNMDTGERKILIGEQFDMGKKFGIYIMEGKKYLYEPFFNLEKVFIFGGGHVGLSLSKITSFINFKTIVIDDREEFANRERFGADVEVVLINSFEDAFNNLEIDESSYIVIMTRGHLKDEIVLEGALKTKAKYIGMIGSSEKVIHTFNNLRGKGYKYEDIKRVHSPIGIRIKSETPEEIAISIAGELIMVKRSE